MTSLGILAASQEISHFRLDGSTSAKKRQRMCKEFNASDETRVFIISVNAPDQR
jgi:SNF2 family DNA or RNA helicase